MIITVDGLAAAGKGTLARHLADVYSLPLLDTGALWRVLAYHLWDAGFVPDNARGTLETAAHARIFGGLDLALVSDKRIRAEKIGQLASVLSCFLQLRRRIDDLQKDWLVDQQQRGVVDGRETGISIAPHADHKFFLVADPTTRATRRSVELLDNDIQAIHASIVARDRREITRFSHPVRPAIDALIIDTTLRSARQVQQLAVDKIEDWAIWSRMQMRAAQL